MTDTQSFIQLLRQGPLADLIAALEQAPGRVNRFLSRPASQGDEQWMPLHEAAEAGHAEAVALLLDRGVHPDCRTRFTTPMHARQTALHLAASEGHQEVMRLLIQAGAEVEVRDALQRSPLWWAARHHHAPCVSRLLRRGAGVEARDAQGRPPLHATLLPPPASNLQAKGSGTSVPVRNPTPTQDSKSALATLNALLKAGADPSAPCPKDPPGYTPLHRCVGLGASALPLARALLQHGANPAAADPRHGKTPADLAADAQLNAYQRLFAP